MMGEKRDITTLAFQRYAVRHMVKSVVIRRPCADSLPAQCLEVMGEPWVESEVIIVPLRVNMCLRGLTLEQLVGRRKDLHLAMVANVREELAVEAPAALPEEVAVLGAAVRRGANYDSSMPIMRRCRP